MVAATFSYSLDRVLVRHGLIHAWGWALAPEVIPDRAELQTLDAAGNPIGVLECRLWQERADLALHFPEVLHARQSGFLVFGALPGPVQTSRAQLVFFKEKQIVFRLPVPLSGDLASDLGRWRRWLAHRWSQLHAERRRNGWRGVLRKLRAMRQRLARQSDIDTCVAALQERLGRGQVSWVVDHDMGGGANLYRDGQIQALCAPGSTPFLLGFHVATLRYFVALPTVPGSPRWQLERVEDFERLFDAFPPAMLVYNSSVSFPEPLVVLEQMLQAKRRHAARLTLLVHDYFLVCPSHTLLNADKSFCAVPDRSACQSCLARHTDGFVSATNVRDVDEWRRAWSDALQQAEEVRFFSEASYHWVRKAYPDVDRTPWRVVPHVLHTPVSRPQLQRGDCLHLAFVGHIGFHKGAEWVGALASARSELPAQVRLTVLGSLEGAPPPGVSITGPYATAKLPSMLESLGVNVVFFSSIWPETFSYVAHELVAMNVPTVCFDLGAPGDLIGAYPRGHVITPAAPRSVLEQMIQFWNRIYPLPGVEA